MQTEFSFMTKSQLHSRNKKGTGIEFVSWAAACCYYLIIVISLACFSLYCLELSGTFFLPGLFWMIITCQEPFPVGSVGKAPFLFPSTLIGHRTPSQRSCSPRCHPITQQNREYMPSFSYHENNVHFECKNSHKEYLQGIRVPCRTWKSIPRKMSESEGEVRCLRRKSMSCACK